MNLRFYVVLFSCLFLGVGARCQKVAVKSNLLYDATATINLGIEFCLAPKWTFDVSGNYNGWTFSGDRKWKHCLVQPEARYWFCDRFSGHFLGGHILGGKYNVGKLKNNISFLGSDFYNPQIQISAESETKRSIFREKDKTKRSKKESAQHSKSRNKSFVMTSVSAL